MIENYYGLEPSYYWQPDKKLHIEADILDHPEKYSDYIGSFKKDGEWSRVLFDGNEVTIQSRTISKKTGEYARKEASLPHLVEAFKALPKDTVLLGEICYDELFLRSKDVGTILRCLPDKAIERQQEEKDKLHFYCFDVLCYDGKDLMEEGFETRISYLEKLKPILDTRYIRYAEIKEVTEIAKEFADYLAAGGEGFVLQKRTNTYQPGKRPAWQTIKLKKSVHDLELKVIGLIEPEEEYTGKELATWKYFRDGKPVTKYFFNGWKSGVIVDFNGTAVRASGITDVDAEWLASSECANFIQNGQLYAKIEAMEIEEDSGSLRHPRVIELRTDVVKGA